MVNEVGMVFWAEVRSFNDLFEPGFGLFRARVFEVSDQVWLEVFARMI